MPPLEPHETLDDFKLNMIERKDYVKFLSEHPSLQPMPKRFRQDLEPLPSELN